MPVPMTRLRYMLPGIIRKPMKIAPTTVFQSNPSSKVSGGFKRSRYSFSSLSSYIESTFEGRPTVSGFQDLKIICLKRGSPATYPDINLVFLGRKQEISH